MDRIKDITAKLVETQDWPEFGAGDTVTVTIKIKEGSKERLQAFQGVVIQRRGSGATETFTVRKMASGGCGAHLPHLLSLRGCGAHLPHLLSLRGKD